MYPSVIALTVFATISQIADFNIPQFCFALSMFDMWPKYSEKFIDKSKDALVSSIAKLSMLNIS